MSSIRLIVSDIDGTILDQHHQVDPALIKLIPQLQEKRFLLSWHRLALLSGLLLSQEVWASIRNLSLATMGLSSSREKRFYLNTVWTKMRSAPSSIVWTNQIPAFQLIVIAGQSGSTPERTSGPKLRLLLRVKLPRYNHFLRPSLMILSIYINCS